MACFRVNFIGTHPALGMSAKVARGVIRSWMSRKHKYWLSIFVKGRLRAFS